MTKTKTILFCSFFLLLFGYTNAQITTFRHVFGGIGDDFGQDIEQTADGGYIITGATGSFGYGQSDVYLLKIDSAGVYEWSKSYGGSNIDWGYDVEITSDSGYIIAGYTNSFGAGGYDFYLIRTNSFGDTLWTKTYGGWDWDYCYSMDITSDNGFILTGETYSYGAGEKDVWLVKTDEFGDTLWTKTFGGILNDGAKSVKETFAGNLIICGYSYTYSNGNADGLLLKTDSIGNTLWFNNYGTPGKEVFNAVIENNDTSGFACIGSYDPNLNGSKINLVKFNTVGNSLWDKQIGSGTNNYGNAIAQRGSAAYIFAGYTSNNLGNIEVTIVDTGAVWWTGNANIGGSLEEDGTGVIYTPGNGYAILGNTKSYGNGYSDILLYKCNNSLNTDTSIYITQTDTNNIKYSISTATGKTNASNYINVFPNPATTNLTITHNLPINKIELVNTLGQPVLIQTESNSNNTLITIKEKINGLYILKISSEKNFFTQKVLFQ